jgi:hypothetical protein
MIGRASQRGELLALLERARTGSGTAALILGEAGMGKSTLAEAVAADAGTTGCRVVWGWCASGDTAPYWPWRTVLDGLGVDHPLRSAASAGMDRAELFGAVTSALIEAAPATPLVVVLEDLQWADLPALSLLDALVSRLRAAPVMLLLTARDETAEAPPEVAAALRALPTSVMRLRLTGLDVAEVGDLFHAVVADAPDDLIGEVHLRTGGNPFFVREVARLVRSQGPSGPVAVPAGVREVVERRLARLSDRAHRALAVAAVCTTSGENIDVPLAAAVTGVPAEEMLVRFDEAVRARLVVESDGGLRFSHALVREVLEAGLPVGDLAELHTSVAECLETARADDDVAGEIARHWSHSVRPDAAARAARWSLTAARTAVGRLGFEQAVVAYRRALAAPDADGVTLRLELGDAQRHAGDVAGSRRTLLDAAAAARTAGRSADLARAALGLGGGPTGFEVRLRDHTAVALLTEALDVLPDGDSPLRAAVLARLSLALTGLDTDARRTDLASRAAAMADRCTDGRIRVAAYAAYCDATAGPDHVAERLAAATRMRTSAELAADRVGMLLASRLRLVALLELGEFALADAETGWYAHTADTFDVALYQWPPAIWRGARALMSGDVAAAFAAADVADSIARRAGSDNGQMMVHTLRIAAHRAVGTIAEYATTIHALLGDDSNDTTTVTAVFAAIAYELGDVDRSVALLRRIVDRGIDAIARDSEYLETCWQIGEAALHLADRRAAALAYAALEPHPRLWAVDGVGGAVFGIVAHQLGRLAILLERYADAAAWLDLAATSHRAAGATLLSAATDAARTALPESALPEPARRGPGRPGPALSGPAGPAPAPAGAGIGAADERQDGQWAEFRREGRLWRLSFRGRSATVPDSKGMGDLAALLSRTGRDVHVLDLVDATGTARATAGDTGPVLDAAARHAYQRRLRDLDDELTAAEAAADFARATTLRTEQQFLTAELAGALGLRGRIRVGGDPAERARKAVHMRITAALKTIDEVHPLLARHLRRAVSTGRFCAYRPEQPMRWHT